MRVELFGPLVISRIDGITDLDIAVVLAKVRVEVTFVALLSLA